jgi:hypothetical protein
MITGVTVAGDLMRPLGDGTPGEADRVTQWLADAVSGAVGIAANLPVQALTTAATPGLRGWIDSLRAPKDADRYWASVHAGLPASPALGRLLMPRMQGRFCIGYEMPPWLVRLLDGAGVPYIDLRLHPVRFMDDLMFAARASCPDTQSALLALAVRESEVIVTAGLRRAMGRFISDASLPDGTLLVAGQRRFDSTQIVGGSFFDATEHAERINGICARYPAAVLKPHPLDPHHSLLAAAAAAPTRVLGAVSDNVYRLLSLPQTGAVLTVNSGLAHEAPYFGKTVHALAPLAVRLAWRGAPADGVSHASVDDIVLVPDFWRLVLAPHAPVSPPDGMRLQAKPNRLRIALDSFWNYQQIDTDRIPRA